MPSLRRLAGLCLPNSVALVLLLCAAPLMLTARASAQTYSLTSLYTFPGSTDYPVGAMAIDANGNIYGVAETGGVNKVGEVYEMVKNGNTYTEQTLYSFTTAQACDPLGGLIRDGSGNLFGTASAGGPNYWGGVWELKYQNGTYQYVDLYDFGGTDGSQPVGALGIDAAGNLFGTTWQGGSQGAGEVFELANNGGNYSFSILYTFQGASDGGFSRAAVIPDKNGNLFGTTSSSFDAAYSGGSVFELVNQGYGYRFQTLYSFGYGNDGGDPEAALTIDSAGNLFGTTAGGGTGGNGTVFEMPYSAGGFSTLNTLYSFGSAPDGVRPLTGVTLDANGNLLGITSSGGANNSGTLYKLVNSSGSYSETILYSFNGPSGTPGNAPNGDVVAPNGDIFGTFTVGFSGTDGIVWELSPSAPTSLTLTPSANPVTSGDSLTLTATVTATPAQSLTGTVTFSAGTTVLGSQTLANNAASITLSSLPTGSDTITAAFSPGSSTVAGSTGSLVEVVNAASQNATLNGPNTFNGNQTVNGTVSATSFSGDGSQLRNVTAAGLACQGCITNYQLGINYAAGDTEGGNALNALNAQALNGLSSSAFAITGAGGNTFAGPQIVNGSITANAALNGTSASFSGPLSSAGVALAPAGKATASQAFNSGALDTAASLYNSNAGAAQSILFRWQAEPAAATNNTPSPAATLNLLYGVGGAPAETGLSVNADGTIHFAAGQTFPGASSGTITGVTAGSGLTGGGTSGSISLGLASNACAPGSAFIALPFACAPFVPAGSSPSFAAITASSFTGGTFSGNGAGLTGVQAAGLLSTATILGSQVNGPVPSATTAANLTGNISESQVSNLATDLSGAVTTSETFATNAANSAQTAAQAFATTAANNAQNTAQTFATNAANTAQTNAQIFATNAANAAQANAETFAASLAGNAQSGALAAAEAYANSTFVPLAGGTMTGALSVPSLNASGNVAAAAVAATSVAAASIAAAGSLTIGGGTPITQYMSITTTLSVDRLHKGNCATFQTDPLNGFTPGAVDTIALGIPGTFMAGLNSGHRQPVFFTFQAWETTTSPNTTLTVQVCNTSNGDYNPPPGAPALTGAIRIDVFKH